MTNKEETRLMRVIGGRANGAHEHGSALVQVIDQLSSETQVEAFGLILERFLHPSYRNGIHVEGAVLGRERFEELKQSLGGMVDGAIAYVIAMRMSVEDASKEIHRVVMQRPTEEERAFCLAWVLLDKFVPYSPIPLTKTTLVDERYQTLQSEMVTDLSRLRTILRFATTEATLGDLVLSVLEDYDDREKRLALLIYFAQLWRKKFTE